jgi:uncharacterized protein (TIGR02147 family)
VAGITQQERVKMSNLPNVFHYCNFRKYLSDYQKARKQSERNFTRSEFTRRLSLPNTRSYFIDVLKGKKVTETFIHRFASVIGLKGAALKYFKAMIFFNQAKNLEEREFYFHRLIELNRTPQYVINESAFSYYRSWYHSVIRALLATVDFRGDVRSIVSRIIPPITEKQARDSVALQKKLGFLKEDSQGFLRPAEVSITAPEFTRHELIRLYQLQLLKQAEILLSADIPQPCLCATNIIHISEKGLARIEKRISKFRSEIRALAHKDPDPPSKVYNLGILFIPHSK